MTRLAIIFSLLFVTPAWAGEVDGKSFFCDPQTNHLKPYALVFQRGKATLYDPAERSWEKDKYTAYAKFVSWMVPGKIFSIDRETLILRLREGALGEITGIWQCEFSSKRAAIKRVKELRGAKDLKAREGNKF